MAPAAPTHYDVLGISRDADATEVRRAWKTLVQVWHPDRFSGAEVEDAQTRAAAINDAYSTLRDTSRRSAYDCRLAADDRDREAAEADARIAARAARRPAARGTVVMHDGTVAMSAPLPLDQQLQAAVTDLFGAMRRRPRTTVAAAIAAVLMFVGIGVFNAVTGPSLPSGAAALPHAARVSARDDRSLEELAAQTRSASEAADDALAQQLQAQQAAAASPVPEVTTPAPHVQQPAPATPQANAQAPGKQAAPTSGQVQEIVQPDGTHVLRILPS